MTTTRQRYKELEKELYKIKSNAEDLINKLAVAQDKGRTFNGGFYPNMLPKVINQAGDDLRKAIERIEYVLNNNEVKRFLEEKDGNV